MWNEELDEFLKVLDDVEAIEEKERMNVPTKKH